MTDIYVDGDACPVREEIYRVAARLRLDVFVVSNGSRPIRPPGRPNVHMVLVGESADAADDWIAEHIAATDVCVTSDIPLASRCLKKGARVVSPNGRNWTPANIGNALAGREIARHLRELGANTSGPAPLTKSDRSRFLVALDTTLQAALREAARSCSRPPPVLSGVRLFTPTLKLLRPISARHRQFVTARIPARSASPRQAKRPAPETACDPCPFSSNMPLWKSNKTTVSLGQCSCACCSVRNAVSTAGDPPQAAQDSAEARVMSPREKAPREVAFEPQTGPALAPDHRHSLSLSSGCTISDTAKFSESNCPRNPLSFNRNAFRLTGQLVHFSNGS